MILVLGPQLVAVEHRVAEVWRLAQSLHVRERAIEVAVSGGHNLFMVGPPLRSYYGARSSRWLRPIQPRENFRVAHIGPFPSQLERLNFLAGLREAANGVRQFVLTAR